MANWSVISVLVLVLLHAAEARKLLSNGALNEQNRPLKEIIVHAADAPTAESPSASSAGLDDKKNFIYGGVGGFAGLGGFAGGIGGMPLIGGLGGIGKYGGIGGGIGGLGGLGGLGGGVGGLGGGAGGGVGGAAGGGAGVGTGGGIFHPCP